MRTRSAFLLAVGFCGAGLLAALWLFRPIDEELDRVHATTDSRLEQPMTRTSPEPPDLERPDTRVVVTTAAPSAPDSAPVAPTTEPAKLTTNDPSDPRTLPETTLAEMELKREAITKHLNQFTAPIILQRFDDGLAEHVADGNTMSGVGVSEFERTTIYGLRHEFGQGINRTVLPRWQYPELYVFKDDIARLDKLIEEKTRAEMQRAQREPR